MRHLPEHECHGDQRKYLREDGLLKEVRKIVERVSLPDNWAGSMLRELDKEEVKGQSGFCSAS